VTALLLIQIHIEIKMLRINLQHQHTGFADILIDRQRPGVLSNNDLSRNELTGVDINSNTNSNSTRITGVMYERSNSKCSNPTNNEDNDNNNTEDNADNAEENETNYHNRDTDNSQECGKQKPNDNNKNNNKSQNDPPGVHIDNISNENIDIVFNHSSRLLRCTADESITHACCGAQLTVINEENAYNNHEDNVNNNTINNSDNTDDVTAMYSVDAQYKTVHHDNDNTNPSTITERKRNNARDRHDTNRNNDVRDVNSETEVNDENDTKVNDDNDNNNNSSRNNHRKFTEKHKSYQQQHLIFP